MCLFHSFCFWIPKIKYCLVYIHVYNKLLNSGFVWAQNWFLYSVFRKGLNHILQHWLKYKINAVKKKVHRKIFQPKRDGINKKLGDYMTGKSGNYTSHLEETTLGLTCNLNSGWWRQTKYKFCLGNLLEMTCLKEQQDGRITLEWILGSSMRIGDGCNWLSIMFRRNFGISGFESSCCATR